MARVLASSTCRPSSTGTGIASTRPGKATSPNLDIDFDGTETELVGFRGFWNNVRLNQIGASRAPRVFRSANELRAGLPSPATCSSSAPAICSSSAQATYWSSALDPTSFTSVRHFFSYLSGDLLEFGTGDLLEFGTGDLLEFGTGVMM